MRILILGANGLAGNTLFRILNTQYNLTAYGTIRSNKLLDYFPSHLCSKIITGIDVFDTPALTSIFCSTNPDVVINCISASKDKIINSDPSELLPVFSLLPHSLSKLSNDYGSRLIHLSSDGVFSGKKGMYIEADQPDANDVYGLAKRLGEVDNDHSVTIRTSLIGHSITKNDGLVDWFLSQSKFCTGFTNVCFSAITTVELANIVAQIILPRSDLHGIYHIPSQPIDKFSLLKIISEVYKKTIEITPDNSVVSNRSLNGDKFMNLTGYIAPCWNHQISMMYKDSQNW
jgi:dTDP-4-dehydrorhamnose reductase